MCHVYVPEHIWCCHDERRDKLTVSQPANNISKQISSMHYFDPTMDWPIELAQPIAPDLLVVYSQTLHDAEAPWNGTAGQSPWSTEWIQYASADGEQRFINMTFFNRANLTKDDESSLNAYLDNLARRGASARRYRSTSGINTLSRLISSRPSRVRPSYKLTREYSTYYQVPGDSFSTGPTRLPACIRRYRY